MIPASIVIDLEAPGAINGGSPSAEQVERLCRLITDLRHRLERREAILVTRPEAARMLGMSASWLEKNTAPAGKCVPCVLCGASVRYRVDALVEWARQREREGSRVGSV